MYKCNIFNYFERKHIYNIYIQKIKKYNIYILYILCLFYITGNFYSPIELFKFIPYTIQMVSLIKFNGHYTVQRKYSTAYTVPSKATIFLSVTFQEVSNIYIYRFKHNLGHIPSSFLYYFLWIKKTFAAYNIHIYVWFCVQGSPTKKRILLKLFLETQIGAA